MIFSFLLFLIYFPYRFKCPSYVLQNLASSGYDTPTPVQMQAIPLMLNVRFALK